MYIRWKMHRLFAQLFQESACQGVLAHNNTLVHSFIGQTLLDKALQPQDEIAIDSLGLYAIFERSFDICGFQFTRAFLCCAHWHQHSLKFVFLNAAYAFHTFYIQNSHFARHSLLAHFLIYCHIFSIVQRRFFTFNLQPINSGVVFFFCHLSQSHLHHMWHVF